jgi:hypothetical protein
MKRKNCGKRHFFRKYGGDEQEEVYNSYKQHAAEKKLA